MVPLCHSGDRECSQVPSSLRLSQYLDVAPCSAALLYQFTRRLESDSRGEQLGSTATGGVAPRASPSCLLPGELCGALLQRDAAELSRLYRSTHKDAKRRSSWKAIRKTQHDRNPRNTHTNKKFKPTNEDQHHRTKARFLETSKEYDFI